MSAELRDAVAKLIKAKGRFHTEQNYAELVRVFDATAAAPAQGELTDALPAPRGPRTSDPRDVAHAAGWNACLDAVAARIRAQQDTASDAARLEFIYQLACVIPFIAPIVTKEKWLEQIDVRVAAREQQEGRAA